MIRSAFRNKTIGRVLLSAGALAILIFVILFPKECSKACSEGILLWAAAVLPSLFPFFILTSVLTGLGGAQKLADKVSPLTRRFKLPSAASYCFLLSALSGYPVGSRIIADLAENGAIDSKQAARLSALCSTSGPMFLIGSVGGAKYGIVRMGAILLASHLVTVLLVCLCFLPFVKPLPERRSPTVRHSADNILQNSVQGAVVSILCVGGFIAFFYVLTQILRSVGALTPIIYLFSFLLAPFGAENAAEGLVYGLLEATHGCAALAASGATLSLPLCAFTVTFGGICIVTQQLGYLKKAGVKAAPFIGIKLLQGIAAFFVCWLLISP